METSFGTSAATVGPDGDAGLSLAALKAGQTCVVDRAELDAGEAAYLRAMGLKPNAQLRVCRLGEPCIVEVMTVECGLTGRCGPSCCRIGLSRALATRVWVKQVDSGKGG